MARRDRTGNASGRAVRRANVFDRYSLLLQLIQVFPAVFASAAFMVGSKTIAILLAALSLVAGTAYVILRERTDDSVPEDDDRLPVPVPISLPLPITFPLTDWDEAQILTDLPPGLTEAAGDLRVLKVFIVVQDESGGRTLG